MGRQARKRWANGKFRGVVGMQTAKREEPTAILRYNPAMPAAPGATKAVGMVPDEMKWEPKSKGLTTPRKKKPKELAVITECCTGCAGSPACVEYCPGGRLHVLGAGRRQHTLRTHRRRSHSLHRLQEMPQQRPRRLLSRRLPVGCHCNGRNGGSGKRSRGDGNLDTSHPERSCRIRELNSATQSKVHFIVPQRSSAARSFHDQAVNSAANIPQL